MLQPGAGFRGIPEQAFDFFAAVAEDTSWEVVEPRRAQHELFVREPMIQLTAALTPEFGIAKVYRLHRSRDYWVAQRAYVRVSDAVVYGVVLDLEGLTVEGGLWRSSSDLVERYRAAVLDDFLGSELEQIAEELESRGYELIGEILRTKPRSVPTDHARLGLLRHRSLLATRALGKGDWLHERRSVDVVRQAWRELRPLVEWLAVHVDTNG